MRGESSILFEQSCNFIYNIKNTTNHDNSVTVTECFVRKWAYRYLCYNFFFHVLCLNLYKIRYIIIVLILMNHVICMRLEGVYIKRNECRSRSTERTIFPYFI